MEFVEWLQQEISSRGWTQSDVVERSRMAGYAITSGALSRIITGDRQAGPDACLAIAYALGVPREEVFKARGWLLRGPEGVVPPGTAPAVAQVARRLQALPDELREDTAEAVERLLDTVELAAQPRRRSREEVTRELLEEAARLHPDLLAEAARDLVEAEQRAAEAASNDKRSQRPERLAS